MDKVVDTVDSIFRNLILFLHYVFPPIVGFFVVFVVCDCDYDGILEILAFANSHMTLSLLIIVALGITVYHIHRAAIHHIFAVAIMSIVKKNCKSDIKIIDLYFARWTRRDSVKCKEEYKDLQTFQKAKDAHAIQKALDIANAGVHFIYCSCWSAIVWYCVFYLVSSEDERVHPFFFLLAILGLVVIAIIGEFWTAYFDLKAYEKYNR
jgi:hypothetical protein